MIRVLIVDDHAVVREGIRCILEQASDMEIGGEAANGIDAVKKVRAGRWDVVLLDVAMPVQGGMDTLKQIKEINAGIRVLMLSMHPENRYAVQLMKSGASGYLMKDAAPAQLVEAIRAVAAGRKHISLDLAELLLQDYGSSPDQPLHELLSNRESQVLRMLGSGKHVSEIAAEMALSVKTVNTYRARILEKMRMKNTAELTCYVVENGLSDLAPERRDDVHTG